MPAFNSILVANRGEIAVRIIRTVKSLGYRTLAVYSVADAHAPHVATADRSFCIGGPEVGDSYLDAQKIIEAARATGAGAIHPGYGFLSENASFARACAGAGIVFIGPSPEAIELMGNKAAAKRRMIAAGVPCVPGYEGEDQSDDVLIAQAARIGFPVMVKAAAGGGGRGMRLVAAAKGLPAALATARSEALNAFGSGELILEKAVERPRHVEIQVFGDAHGQTIHLGERDCSVQRRHQKVVEEAPCPVMKPELRARMGAAAVAAAASIGYQGAGTVEFLLSANGEFYFLEMNTRLQVEHPVTEMITGLDLVAMQIAVAHGKPLGLRQEDVTFSGHAIEVRLYAEDPSRDFLPSTGRALLWRPAEGEGVRVDHGLSEGQEITPFYDPMVAKVIAWGQDREIARQRLLRALEETALVGPETNKAFLIRLLGKDAFAKGEATTAFIAEQFEGGRIARPEPLPVQAAIAAILQYRIARAAQAARAVAVGGELLDWQSSRPLGAQYSYAIAGEPATCQVVPRGGERYELITGGQRFDISIVELGDSVARLRVDGLQHDVWFCEVGPAEIALDIDGADLRFVNIFALLTRGEAADGDGGVTAPMHGKLQRLFVKAGDRVEAGQGLATVEAMKMEHSVVAPFTGTVSGVLVLEGEQVAANALILQIEPDKDA